MSEILGFFEYMNERESIRLKKAAGEPPPWTDDPVLQKYKFTNVKRFHDKTTQYFYNNHYLPNRDSPPEIILLNCAILRYFGSIEFAEAIGWQHKWAPDYLYHVADERRKQGKKVFTGAYVITNQGIARPKHEVVVYRFLHQFEARSRVLAGIAKDTQSWRLVCEELRKLEGFGGTGFIAKEILQDAILTPVLEKCLDLKTWSPCGIGARRGLNRIFGREVKASQKEEKFIEEMRYLLEVAPKHVADYVQELDLSLHDIQFSLCEYDKKRRVELGQGTPRSRYNAPKSASRGFF